jgi:hypothetical protein
MRIADLKAWSPMTRALSILISVLLLVGCAERPPLQYYAADGTSVLDPM